jgi:4-amino-4-deoxychorismate lyase
MDELIFIDGKHFKEALPLRSLFYGEGLFETFRWKGPRPVFIDRHIERMKKGAEVLGLPSPAEEEIKESLDSAISNSQIRDAYVKLCLLSGGSTVFYERPLSYRLLVIVGKYKSLKKPAKARISSFKRSSTSPILRLKSLNYLENIIARREAMERGFDEAIFFNENNELCEGSASNIFWFKEETLYTPALECGLLPGITRGLVIELAKELGIEILEGRFDLDSLISSQGAFFTNSLIGAIRISHVNDFSLSDSKDFERIRTALINMLDWE